MSALPIVAVWPYGKQRQSYQRVNKVNLRRTMLVLRQVIVAGISSCFLVCNHQLRHTQPPVLHGTGH